MKKILFFVILLTGITKAKHAHAQNNNNLVFDVPAEKFTRQFTVELDRKNSMQVSVTSMQVLDYISNIDSILKVFMSELRLISDSLPLRTIPLRIDYNMDVPTVKKLRVRKTIPPEDYYAFINGSPSFLKMHQDTLVIQGKIPAEWLRRSKNIKERNYGKYYFSMIFYLNDLEDILAYKDGRLNEKIKIIQQNYKSSWQYRDDERMQLKKYPEITSNTAQGYIFPSQFFSLKKSLEVQNYKDHFVPSISCKPTFAKDRDFIKRELGLSIEAAFTFEHPANASTKTYVNVFAGITYNVTPLVKTRNLVKFYPYLDLAYLVSRSGTVYDKNSFRLGLGSLSAGNLTTRIQPALYFSNLFKQVTPSLKIVQRF